MKRRVTLLFDLALLFTSPIVFGIGAGVTVFFFSPLPALIFSLLAASLHTNTIKAVGDSFNLISLIARIILVAVTVVTYLGSDANLLILNQIVFLILFFSTYNSWYTTKYGRPKVGSGLAIYVLELYIFALLYICIAIVRNYYQILPSGAWTGL
jgi:hypothetical protein